jgi:hypothetical protein
MKMTDGSVAIISSATGDALSGVLAREKIASDGRTQVAVFKKGRFMATCSGAVVTGNPLVSYASAEFPNQVGMANETHSGSVVLGYPEEDGTDQEEIVVRLDL